MKRTPFLANIRFMRASMREQNALLRRARRLYIATVQGAIKADPTNDTLDYCALRMIEIELYATKDERTVRWSILRQLCKNDISAGRFVPKRRNWEWHEWSDMNDINFSNRHFKGKVLKQFIKIQAEAA